MQTLPRKNLIAGLFCILLGAFITWNGSGYGIGTLERPDPGFLPVILGSILLLCGGGITIGALRQSDTDIKINLRPYVAIPLALVLFALMIDRFGLVPSVAVTTLVSSLGQRNQSLLGVLALTGMLVVFTYAVFVLVLNMPLEPFMWRP